ncbi:alpha-D-ribose 1-methylphosphonate 5-triphosphate synthase subunit PhnG [Paraburkholderia eburnea]|uniref:Alpha-D-ribose 1-methylphosphonate 5-triphosphate synthase subunit PhnG n=1 Tax=Paraburkholderia eburnea TaxID=1189126 RepID=A0A2S4MI97_9BURK|nr:phosphonate C-P lyase system protein PhnG [Paraburkholderia eburnea]POR54483.1 alpha-D-ribose 1-methylphosphonate 5-triphosphate synthase subunit PhnG [Paraburkholderia eburnea]PRZ19698.1 alpha-D-ribose 1-methylphosphonate 5-triphosphate synthase subunit PhnG [Paraburkholderia eburnea]
MNASSAPSSAAGSAARRAWMAVLARTPRADLEAAFAAALGGEPAPSFDWLRAPQTGLAMVRGRVGGTGNAFNLGEATVTRATLRLRAPHGQAATVGVACHLGRDKRRAELAALADALLQQPERHERLHAQLIEPLIARLEGIRAARRDDTASTKVEFFTMVRGDA